MSDEVTEWTDVVVIGMGPGGEAAAGSLARAGLEVVGIERELVGGECPYWGCVPTKMMIRAANLLAEARRIPGMAGQVDVSPDWGPVAQRIREEATTDWDDTAAVERFEEAGGVLVRGSGRIVGPGRVAVGERVIGARRGVVVASGTSAAIPPLPGLDQVEYWTNREAVGLAELPASLLVLGGGAIGVELAQVFARFGVRVGVVEAMDRLVPGEETEVGEILAEVFAAEGIEVCVGVGVAEVRSGGAGVVLILDDGRELEAEHLLVATGRRADLDGVGLGAVGVDTSARWVPVDEHQRVTDGVWALGDICGQGAFTHVAIHQAEVVVADIVGEEHPGANRLVPRVTFTDPEIGSVGVSAAQAAEDGVTVAVGRAQVPSTARGWIHGSGNEGLVTLVADVDRGVLVGASVMGPHGGEVLGLLALAVHAQVPLDQLRSMIYAYPTFHRGIEDALADLAA